MSGTVNGNLSTEYVALSPGVSEVEIAAMAAGYNANEIMYQPPEPPAEGTTATPDDTWLKADIAAWLDDKGIVYSTSATKADLLALVPTGA